MNTITFFRDCILVQFVNKDAKSNKTNTLTLPVYTPNARNIRVWFDGEFAKIIEHTPPEWHISVFNQTDADHFEGRIESIETNSRNVITFFGHRVDNEGESTNAQRRRYIISPKSFLLSMIEPDLLQIKLPYPGPYKQLITAFELSGVSWTFSHLLRFAEDKKSAILETIIDIPPLEIVRNEDQPETLFDEMRFVNTNYYLGERKKDRAYGETRFAAMAKRTESAASNEDEGSSNSWGQWVMEKISLVRHRAYTLSALSAKIPAIMSLVYMFEGLAHQNPSIFVDLSSPACQEILQKVETGPLTIYDATGNNLSHGSQLDSQTKRIDMGKFLGVSIKCQRMVDNLQDRFHDEKFSVVNKTNVNQSVFIWHPQEAIKAETGGKEYRPELDAELNSNVIKVPLFIKPGRTEVLYRWFYS